ncbi:carboxymuconolactone decarboxylase family protein [Mesoaciditoga sp.]
MTKKVEDFKKERDELNDVVMKYAKKHIKRFYNLDTNVYLDGALPRKTKELLGLVSSLVLRCDDCVEYHLITSDENGVTTKEIEEALAIGLVVGGSIVIPHLRRAFKIWDELQETKKERILSKIESALNATKEKEKKLRRVCEILEANVEHYDWVGFYLVNKKKELVLGPFIGESTEHVKIKFGEGICGQAAELERTFVVQDVSKESNYLSCSPKVKSEIVVPIFKNGKVVGELDIDSHRTEPFTKWDEELLSKICDLVGKII